MQEKKLSEFFGEIENKIKDTLSDAEILLGFSQEDVNLLREESEILTAWADEIIDHFYDTLLKNPKAKEIVKKYNIDVAKLKSANKKWYREIVSGNVNEKFFRYSFFVGLLHIYYDVDNDMMIFMADVLRRKFLEKCLNTYEKEKALKVYEAFSKVVAAFVGFTVEGYVFMLKKSLFDILGMKPQLVDRMMKMELKRFIEETRGNFKG